MTTYRFILEFTIPTPQEISGEEDNPTIDEFEEVYTDVAEAFKRACKDIIMEEHRKNSFFDCDTNQPCVAILDEQTDKWRQTGW